MDLLHGTLDMLVLRTLVFGPSHGYAIAQSIRSTSDDAIALEFGSLYPALKRLELQGWIDARWDLSDQNRRIRVYRLTPAGRRQLRAHESEWKRFVRAVSSVLKPIGGKAQS